MGDLKDGYLMLGNYANDWYAQNKPHFWTGVSMVGTIATAVSSASDTARIFRKARKEHGCDPSELPVKERLKLYAANYPTTAVCAGISIFGAGKSDLENGKIIAERTGLYLATKKGYDLLKKNLKEVVGEKKAQQVQDKVAEEKVQEAMAPTVFGQKSLLSVDMFENAPRSGHGQLFPWVDGYSMLPMWTNVDHVDMTIMKLNDMMHELKARGYDEFDYFDRPVGIPYSEWLSFQGYNKSVWNTPERKNHGWNKGFAKNGEDDDVIAYYRTTIEIAPGFPVCVMNWEKEPSDMRLGRLIKSSNL